MATDDERPELHELFERNVKIASAMGALEDRITELVRRPADQVDVLAHIDIEYKSDVIEAALGSHFAGRSVDPGLYEAHANLNDVLRRHIPSPKARSRLFDHVVSEFEPAVIDAAMGIFEDYFPDQRNSERERPAGDPSDSGPR